MIHIWADEHWAYRFVSRIATRGVVPPTRKVSPAYEVDLSAGLPSNWEHHARRWRSSTVRHENGQGAPPLTLAASVSTMDKSALIKSLLEILWFVLSRERTRPPKACCDNKLFSVRKYVRTRTYVGKYVHTGHPIRREKKKKRYEY